MVMMTGMTENINSAGSHGYFDHLSLLVLRFGLCTNYTNCS